LSAQAFFILRRESDTMLEKYALLKKIVFIVLTLLLVVLLAMIV